MNRKLWNALIGMLWLALPLNLLQHWLVWDRLPLRMATHFDAAGHPNGWMTREGSLWFNCVLLAFLLSLFTFLLSRVRKLDATAWTFLGFCYLIVAVIYQVEAGILAYNLYGRPMDGPFLVGVPVAIVLLVSVFLFSRRGTALPQSDVVREEVHASPAWASLFIVLLVGEAILLAAVPVPAARVALALVCLLFVLVAAQAWSGFHYQFRHSGIEIRTLGFRLRSIPVSKIKEYAVASWSPWCGYGIRGIGNRRAYVWGNQGVRIRTTDDDEVFLGHSEPQRLLQDLDLIKGFSK
jgi:hypothetical protein